MTPREIEEAKALVEQLRKEGRITNSKAASQLKRITKRAVKPVAWCSLKGLSGKQLIAYRRRSLRDWPEIAARRKEMRRIEIQYEPRT